MKKIIAIALAAVAALSSCNVRKGEYIDFNSIQYTDGMFIATSTNVTDLSEGLPPATTLPDGTPVNEPLEQEGTKATSFGGAEFLQNFMAYSSRNKVMEISGIYESEDELGRPITLSGKVIVPVDVPVKRVMVVSHYTVCTDAEAPSNVFPLEGKIAQMGYALVCPDYIGYGVSSDRYHPYLLMETTARNVVDMYLSVIPFLKAIGKMPRHDDIYLMGYSQGGGTTMAVEYLLERDHGPKSLIPIKINRVFAGGGIYDIKATFENFVETNTASYPVGVPFVIVGQVKGNHLPDELIDILLRPEISCHTEEWFLKKNITSGRINTLIGTKRTDKILSEVALDRTNEEIAELYKYMTRNSVLSLAWEPQAPVYMMHSIEDDTVPFENATKAKVRWENANIQYNFGNYGSHIKCALRFVFTVMTILADEK